MSERHLVEAELLAIGSELTVGDTRDTNGGDLARELTALGVRVTRLSALPDELGAVTTALREALGRADLVVTTGGLGPTPDDLTREAIAAVCGEAPHVDPALLGWLEELFARRGMRMPLLNRKQAWLIPSATPLANAGGTAPGWWVERPDGRLVVALPGPPREMRPMWRDVVVPRLQGRGLGLDRAATTLRVTGLGESVVAELIGEDVLRSPDPEVATYARDDAVDVRISAVGGPEGSATERVEATAQRLLKRLGPHVFGRDGTSWVEALGSRLEGRRLAVVEIGSAGRLQALLGEAPWLVFGELLAPGSEPDLAHPWLGALARHVREIAGAEVGLALRARETAHDTAVTMAVALGDEVSETASTAFLTGEQGRRRAALAACAELWRRLGSSADDERPPGGAARP